MKKLFQCAAAGLLLADFSHQLSTAFAQGTAFTYQGQLKNGSAPANGHYDFIFQVFDAANGGNSLGGALATNSIGVSNGLFTVALDFGGTPFAGQPCWLQIAVTTNGAGNYSTLLPRQTFTASPYAIYAGTAGTVSDGGITSEALANGAVGNVQLAANAVNGNNIAGGQVVKSLNGLMDQVTLVAGDNVTLNTVGNSLQISAASGAALLTNVALLNLVNIANVATAVPTISYGFLVDATLTSYGSGYMTAPTVTVNDATGSGAVIIATVSHGEVTSLTVQDAGLGYSDAATLTIAPPPSNAYQTFAGANVFTGVNNFTNPNNSFTGLFTGNGAGLTNVPYAANAGSANSVSATNIVGTIPATQLPASVITNGSSGVTITGTFSGNGTGVTNVPGTLVQVVAASTNIMAQANTVYDLTNSAEVSVSLPASIVSWTEQTGAPTAANWSSVASSSDGTDLVALSSLGGNLGGLYTSTNSGVTWTEQTGAPPSTTWHSVASSADGTYLVAAANGGGIYTSANSGATWTEQTSTPTSANWSAVASSADGIHLVAVTDPGGIYNTTTTTVSGAAGTSEQFQYLGNGVWQPLPPIAGYFPRNGSTVQSLSTVVTNGESGVTLSGTFGGNGNGLTSLNVANLTGTIADGLLSANVALCAGGNHFTGNQIITSGYLGIGLTSPTYPLEVASNGVPQMTLDTSGNLECAGTVYSRGIALTSDRNLKENFTTVDNQAVLAKVAALPLSEWNYKSDNKDIQHIGPMAQDFHSAFGLDGADDKHISVVDEGGVALAAIQGLNQKLEDRSQELEDRNQKLERENTELKQRLEALEKIVLPHESN